MQTIEQLRKKYGYDYYFVVGGNFGERTSNSGMSEEDAIKEYESRKVWECTNKCNKRQKPKAAYIIICVPSETCGRFCYRGWIDDSRFCWDDSDDDSLRVILKINKKSH